MSTVAGAVETRDFVELPTYLSDIVGDADSFFVGSWGARPQVFRYPAGTRLLSSADIWKALDCGSLVTPYFCVLSDGGASVNNVTQTRDVLNRPLAGYADAEAIRGRFGSGYTIKLTQTEDWHPDIKKLVAGLRTELRAEVRSFIFFTPQGSSGVPAHADEAHVFVLQVEGRADWHVGVANGEEICGEQSAEIGLKPGDALYIPPGRPYHGTTAGTDSLYVAITVQQPTARDLAGLMLAEFLNGPRATEIAGTHHRMTVAEKVSWLRDSLAEHLSGQDLGALVDEAVRIRQRDGRV
jgi:ribosomal protein L16 Arg81 hydroxylase